MNQKIIKIHDECANGHMDRREFLRRIAHLGGGSAAAYILLAQLEETSTMAEVVPKNNPRLHTEYIMYPGETGDVRASLARPKGDTKLPGVIVIHENRGLQPHRRRCPARRTEGFSGHCSGRPVTAWGNSERHQRGRIEDTRA